MVNQSARLRWPVVATLLSGFLATLITIGYLSLASPARAEPTSTSDRAEAAAGWLARQMVDGERFESEFNGQKFPDQGLTLDAVLAFAAAGVADDFANKALAWLAKPDILQGYLGYTANSSYAGAHAKLAFAVQVRGGDPSAFGEVDLLTKLRSLQTPSGRFSDVSEFGDFSNAFTQTFAILALDRTTTGVPAIAVDFLANSQCQEGGFSVQFGQPTCTSDVDATAMATQALLATGRVADANEALNWLVSAQRPDGSFVGSPPANVANANSTGLATQALRVAQRDDPADKAVTFLRGLQLDCADPVENRGAVALDTSGFEVSKAPRATAQATLGMAGIGLAELSATDAAAGAPVLNCADPTSATPPSSAPPSSIPATEPSPSAPPATSSNSAGVVVPPPSLATQVAQVPLRQARANGAMPLTGKPIATMVLISTALLVIGIVMLVFSRSRRNQVSTMDSRR